MSLHLYSRLKLGIVLAGGALLALVLCVQCVRTYLYANQVLIPQQAQREAERQGGVLSTAARSAGISDPRALGPVIEHALESSSDSVLWMRVLDPSGAVLAQGGTPQGAARIPPDWWSRIEKHESLGSVVDSPKGQVLVTLLPFRMPRVPRRPELEGAPPAPPPPHAPEGGAGPPPGRPGNGRRPGAYLMELAIPLNAVAGSFEGLRQNLIMGVVASCALLAALLVIALRTPHYLRGKYLENELQLAKRVQKDLQPKPHPVSSEVVFAAAAVAADQVGGDFYDVFETSSGRIAIVLGDVSGKGVSAALLGSVLQGAIRSSTATQHESACARINQMMCERTACERFATLFWGIFDPTSNVLRYVNAGHAAPMLLRRSTDRLERLEEGGPVIGILPAARYSAGTVAVDPSDLLVLYSDGIHEAANAAEEEFGEDRIREILTAASDVPPVDLCDRIMREVATFASAGPPPDDRTLVIVEFPSLRAALTA